MEKDMLEPLKMIDIVLSVFCEDISVRDENGNHTITFEMYPDILENYVVKKYPNYNWLYQFEFVQFMLNKLEKDNYLERVAHANVLGNGRIDDTYRVTFEGLVFYNSGGYQGVLNRQSEEKNRVLALEKRQEKNEKTMKYLTLVLTAQAVLMLIIEIVKLSIDKDQAYAAHVMEIATVGLILLIGAAAGLFLYFSITLAARNKEKAQ